MLVNLVRCTNNTSVTHKTSSSFDLIHVDVWGPSSDLSKAGFKYYLSVVDDFIRFTWIFPLVNKSEVANILINFIIMIERQFSKKIKAVQSDMGGEFIILHKHFQTLGIEIRHSCPYTHQMV